MRIGSFRWWFENRQTGEITVAQSPNWPLYGALATVVVRIVADRGSTVDDIAAGAFTALLLYWGADEIIRGVNPWRRLLGTAVVAWQVTSLVT